MTHHPDGVTTRLNLQRLYKVFAVCSATGVAKPDLVLLCQKGCTYVIALHTYVRTTFFLCVPLCLCGYYPKCPNQNA